MENAVTSAISPISNLSSLVTDTDVSPNIPTMLMILENFTEALKNEEALPNQDEISKSKDIENDLKLLKAIMPDEGTTAQELLLTEEKAKEEDIQVNYGSPCDFSDNNSSCWYEREVGDTLTLDVNITSSKDENAFAVRWKRMYQKYKQKQCVYIKLETERLPWNMVLGSANRELRIDPVTNTDLDPNAISAKVFLVSRKDGKKTYLLIRELIFRIQIPATDMGSLYPGEEINVNLENFVTLPENGNFLFDWKMERSDGKTRTLPSNFKKSTSGRSVVVKEFKRAQAGIIVCVVYSSTGIAVAKRRFSINRVLAASERRRALIQDKSQNKRSKRHKHRRIIKRCNKRSNSIPESTALRLLESSRPLSRKKRFRKTPTTDQARNRSARNCKHHNRLHPRWIPSILDDDDTTLDPRIMPVQKLVELSENSDGTLDDIIPHEVHYVEPVVTVVTDYFPNFWKPPDFQPNCSTDSDCGDGALCIIPQGHKTNKVTGQGHKGYCYCKSAYFGDGFTCIKIPRGNHRDKRIRREIYRKSEEFKIQPHLFYDRSMTNVRPVMKKEAVQKPSPLESLRISPLMIYEDEDSYLVSECTDKRDCSQHAICFQGDRGHPYCKCNPGYRGNGIFCWEMIDFIKDKDQVTEMAPD
ncbi:uncharacterized protein LOC129971716 [Argiope bruennichi]|uniref:uncharacterized protein LOC129971716 n=1 Tax=Argiope bruennichi TaxID=94029 RepID=UPI0024951EA4|nr:uncharacterized protein LOC129971716 [Argiope bruennichi]